MKNAKTFEQYVLDNKVPINESGSYDAAFNINVLKNIQFNLGSWSFFDEDAESDPKPFHFDFNGRLKRSDVDKKISAAQRKHKAAKEINTKWEETEFYKNRLELTNLNYAGLTFIFAALDDLYGKFGAGMGWH
jgi:hypothetical protein